MSKITAYTALTTPQYDDVVPIVDVHDTSMASSGTTKKITLANLAGAAVISPSGDATGATDSARITAAFAASKQVSLAAGTFYINAAIAMGAAQSLSGAGYGATTINQVSTSANGITISGPGALTGVQVTDLTLSGPSSGTGIGISAASTTTDQPVQQLVLRNLTVQTFGSHGVQAITPIVSVLDNVFSQVNGGRGFYLTGVPADGVHGTSIHVSACYANNNALDGFYLQALAYSSLTGCAADTNATGYVLAGCRGVTLNGCGAESTTAKNALDGTSFKITQDSSSVASSGIVLNGCRVIVNNAAGFWVTGSSQNVMLNGIIEASPGGSATASVKTDAGTMSTLAGYDVATATSLHSLTYNELNNGTTGEFTLAGTAFLNVAETFGTLQLKGQDASDVAAQFFSGTLKTVAVAGGMEYDGVATYITNDTTSGRGLIPVDQYFRLTATGGTISTIANFFGTTSNISLVANAEYEIEIDAWFLKTTAGTVTWTFTNSAAPTSMNLDYQLSPATGIVSTAAATDLFGQQYNITTAAPTVVSGTLTTAVNHRHRFWIRLINGTGTSLKIQATASAGTLTPGINSYWKARRVPLANVGTFAA